MSDDSANHTNPILPEVLLVTYETNTEELLITTEFVPAQTGDPYCRKLVKSVGQPELGYLYDRDRVLLRHSKIDGILQKDVPTLLRPHLIYLAYHPILTGHPGKR